MKSIDLKDALTGKDLHIEFDLDKDIILINGEKADRKKALESNEDQFVFGPLGPGPWEIIHLTRAQINEMRTLWGLESI